MLDALKDKLKRTKVTMREVGLREGLQSHTQVLPTAVKVDLFKGLAAAGVKEINAVSFVRGDKMPHMADAEELLRSLGNAREGVEISGVVLSPSGLKRALTMKSEGLLDLIFLVYSPVNETMASNGIAGNSEDLLKRMQDMAAEAADAGLKVGTFCSETFGSPTQGWIDPELVIETAARLTATPGVTELIISDSTGQGDPLQVLKFFTALARTQPTDRRLCYHVHDSRGAGLANILAALSSPFTNFVFDSSFGGYGGDFPFIPDAFGNVATEDLAEMLYGMGFRHGVDPDAIAEVTKKYVELTRRPLSARLGLTSGSLAWKRRMPEHSPALH